jgi:hypothetical protein
MSYSELLRNPKWQRKRLEIFQRDNFTCQKCNDTESNLQVHHHYYNFSFKPWEYPNEALITYCELCHFKVEFYKWAEHYGTLNLIYQGFLINDIEDVKSLVFAKIESNRNKESVIRYAEQIKILMSNA